ncbi:tryptophan-rich sensory protein [Pseudarthrobacter sp. Fe7]|nr:tryptophan-rich sensory protein [Pseudarthrobacter sp. Fe7]
MPAVPALSGTTTAGSGVRTGALWLPTWSSMPHGAWLFWRSRRPWLAAAEAAVLAASSADLVRRTYRLHRTAGASLAPYAAWCGFATVLSAAIARLNPGKP